MAQREDQLLAQLIAREGGEIAHDMAHHLGDEMFELMKRHGLAQRSEVGATAMLTIAATRLLEQAIDQCSRAAEEDCRGAVVRLFLDELPDSTRSALSRSPLVDRVVGQEGSVGVADKSAGLSPTVEPVPVSPLRASIPNARPTYLPPGTKLVPFCAHMDEPGNAYDLAKALRGPITHVCRKNLQRHFKAPRAERLLPDEPDLMEAIIRVLTEGFVGNE